MGDYSCYYNDIRLNLHKYCDSGKSQSQRRTVVLRCTLSSSVEELCVFDSGLGESEIPTAPALRELNNTSVCMNCCDGFCYLPHDTYEIPPPTSDEDIPGYLASAVISFTFTLLVVLFGVFVYRLVKRRRRESSRAQERYTYERIHPPRAPGQTPPVPVPRESPSLEMDDLSTNKLTSSVSRSLPSWRQTTSDVCIACGQSLSSRRPSEKRTLTSSSELDGARSHPCRASGRSIHRRVNDLEATPAQLDRVEDAPSIAPPLPPRRGSSASSSLGSVPRDEQPDSERQETEPSIVLLGLEPAFHISKLVRDLESSHRKKRRRHASGSVSGKKSSLSVYRPSQRSSSMF